MSSSEMPKSVTIGRVVGYHRPIPASTTQLVVLHGALRSARDLASLNDLLPGQDQLLIDLPGHGQAPHSLGGYTAESLAEAVQAAIAHCCDARPILIFAESFSGLAALCLAALNASVKHIVLADPPLDTSRMRAAQKALLRTWQENEKLRQVIVELGRDFFGFDVETGSITSKTYHHYLYRCPVPITIITGTLKSQSEMGSGAFFNQQDLDLLRNLPPSGVLPRFSVAQIQDVGHSVFQGAPKSVTRIISHVTSSLAPDSNSTGEAGA